MSPVSIATGLVKAPYTKRSPPVSASNTPIWETVPQFAVASANYSA
jgi:hypothetical protein